MGDDWGSVCQTTSPSQAVAIGGASAAGRLARAHPQVMATSSGRAARFAKSCEQPQTGSLCFPRPDLGISRSSGMFQWARRVVRWPAALYLVCSSTCAVHERHYFSILVVAVSGELCLLIA